MARVLPASWRGRARRTVVLVVGMLAAALVAGGVSSAASATAGGHEPGVLLAAGQAGSRAQVPWSKVGRGWTLAEDALTTQWTTPQRSGPVLLYLVGPRGGRYQVYRWAKVTPRMSGGLPQSVLPQLVDWSGDKTRALVVMPVTGLVQQIDLVTGRLTRVRLPHGTFVAGYSKPDGLALLAWRDNGRQLVRLTLNGALERVLWTYRPGGYNSNTTLETADGTELVLSSAAGLQLISNAGPARLGLPAGGGKCVPIRWWNATTVLAQCAKGAWLVPISGARPSRPPQFKAAAQMTVPLTRPWRIGSGYYFQLWTVPGSGRIYKVSATGSTSPEPIAGAPYGPQILAASGQGMLVWAFRIAADMGVYEGSLLWFNPATHAQTRLLWPADGKDGIAGAVTYGSGRALNAY